MVYQFSERNNQPEVAVAENIIFGETQFFLVAYHRSRYRYCGEPY